MSKIEEIKKSKNGFDEPELAELEKMVSGTCGKAYVMLQPGSIAVPMKDEFGNLIKEEKNGKEVTKYEYIPDLDIPGKVFIKGGINNGKIMLSFTDAMSVYKFIKSNEVFLNHNTNLETLAELKNLHTNLNYSMDDIYPLAERKGLSKDYVDRVFSKMSERNKN
ncbi:hypothetical protein HNP92_001746 [Methanococcus maripaludis]|uniref:Uncharacterized protein n=1 Tax=Methanococcus maripaludis TaxID=39152 RepID=A0A7J9S977_METMI|nr:hypothetical protein [Methanococcus maripaludis]MBB6402424.1 hypothetical protein [Methanococcus maripaludis]